MIEAHVWLTSQRTPHIIGQYHNEEIHRRHLARYGTEVEIGTELLSLIQDDDGVTAELIHHKDGQETKETVRAKYLVSAEGARSEFQESCIYSESICDCVLISTVP